MSAMAASPNDVAATRAAVWLKVCFGWRMPPARIAAPRTRRRLPMIDPVREAFTTPVNPLLSATRLMMSSAALPKVALRKPPMPEPERAASCSVARPIQPAKGTIAIAATTKRRVSFRHAGTYRSAIAIGTASSSKSSGVNDQLDFGARGMLQRSLASAITQATLSLQASSNLRYAQGLGRKLVNRTIPISATVNGCAVKGSDAVTDHASIGKSSVRRALEAMSYTLGPGPVLFRS